MVESVMRPVLLAMLCSPLACGQMWPLERLYARPYVWGTRPASLQWAKKAAVWYEKAMKAGDLASTTRLAALYAEARGVRKDENRARELYIEAAERRDPEAEWQMAWMLLNGKRGMEKNEEKGRGWLQRAARQGHAEALKEMARRKW